MTVNWDVLFEIGLEWKIACQAALPAAAKTDIIYFIFIIFCCLSV